MPSSSSSYLPSVLKNPLYKVVFMPPLTPLPYGTGKQSTGQEANKENIEHSSDRRELFGEEKQNKNSGWLKVCPQLGPPRYVAGTFNLDNMFKANLLFYTDTRYEENILFPLSTFRGNICVDNCPFYHPFGNVKIKKVEVIHNVWHRPWYYFWSYTVAHMFAFIFFNVACPLFMSTCIFIFILLPITLDDALFRNTSLKLPNVSVILGKTIYLNLLGRPDQDNYPLIFATRNANTPTLRAKWLSWAPKTSSLLCNK